MSNHELKVIQIKSRILDLWTENIGVQSYSRWFDLLKPLLCQHFEIKQVDLLIYDKARDVYLPLHAHKIATTSQDAISFEISDGQQREVYVELFREKGFEYVDEFIVFRDENSKPLALLLFKATSSWRDFSDTIYRNKLEVVISDFIRSIKTMGFLMSREKTFRQLFTVTELFNSTMSSQIILDGIMDSVTDSFPTFNVKLILSHDQKDLTHSYALFDYSNERPSAIDAFLSGKVTIEKALDLGLALLNAPIKGRQGTYGLLQLYAPADYFFLGTQQNFIRMLANTAGSALENASLYDQSYRLVEDLKLVNETSQKLNSNMHSDEMLEFLKQQLIRAFLPTQVAFVFYKDEKEYDVSDTSDDYFSSDAGKEYINFLVTQFSGNNQSFFEANFSSKIGNPVPYESVIAIPIKNQEHSIGFVICMHEKPYYFSFDNFKLAELLIGHASLALANSMLRDQLQELADKDYLTKLYARRYLDNRIRESIEKDEGGVFILLDIDDFKRINDTDGHEAGDIVLKQVAMHMRKKFRGTGISARWGGEEFAVYLPSMDEVTGSKIAEQFIEKIPSITSPSVTISAGMSHWKAGQNIEFTELFNSSDVALYSAKYSGKNQLVIYGANSLNT